MTRPVPDLAVTFIQKAEARPPVSYYDSGHVLTGGWGHTGFDVPPAGTTVTLSQALAWLDADLMIAADRLARCVDADTISHLSDHQYSALISFVFNTGADPKWTIWKVLKGGNLDQVPPQMMRFVNADGRKLDGLVNRRTAEVALWNTADAQVAAEVAAAVPVPPSSETRAADSTPTIAPAKPFGGTALTTKIVGLVSAAGVAAKQVNDLVSPHTDIHVFAEVSAVLIGVTIVAGVVALWVSHKQEKARSQ